MDGETDDSFQSPHLALFQAMGKLLIVDPTAVTAQISAWLSDENSPVFWAPFAFSIRGLAYEVMDECELARMDYLAGLRRYEELVQELGEDAVKRMKSNVKFIQVRLDSLPPPSSPDSFYEAAPMLLSQPEFTIKQEPEPERNIGPEGATQEDTAEEQAEAEAGELKTPTGGGATRDAGEPPQNTGDGAAVEEPPVEDAGGGDEPATTTQPAAAADTEGEDATAGE